MVHRAKHRLWLLVVLLGVAWVAALSGGHPQPVGAQAPSSTPLPSPTPVGAGGGQTLEFPARGFSGVLLPGGGLQITSIVPGSLAEASRLRVNDVILSVAGVAVDQNTLRTVTTRLNDTRRTATLLIRRGTLVATLLLRAQPLPTPTPRSLVTRTPRPTAVPPGGIIIGQAGRVALGVTYEVVTEALAQRRNLSVTYGALVIAVVPTSPADVAGIQVDDIILEVEGDRVDAKRPLVYRMQPYVEGDTVTLRVLRRGEQLEVRVTLVALRGSA